MITVTRSHWQHLSLLQVPTADHPVILDWLNSWLTPGTATQLYWNLFPAIIVVGCGNCSRHYPNRKETCLSGSLWLPMSYGFLGLLSCFVTWVKSSSCRSEKQDNTRLTNSTLLCKLTHWRWIWVTFTISEIVNDIIPDAWAALSYSDYVMSTQHWCALYLSICTSIYLS